jgi:hypothetical protein
VPFHLNGDNGRDADVTLGHKGAEIGRSALGQWNAEADVHVIWSNDLGFAPDVWTGCNSQLIKAVGPAPPIALAAWKRSLESLKLTQLQNAVS